MVNFVLRSAVWAVAVAVWLLLAPRAAKFLGVPSPQALDPGRQKAYAPVLGAGPFLPACLRATSACIDRVCSRQKMGRPGLS